MINFKLKNIDDVLLAGNEGSPRMSWFWLTDADLWINLGDSIIYEYTKEAQAYFDHKISAYNDYPLVRFIEDFTEKFDVISENIPDQFYKLVPELNTFLSESKSWLDENQKDEDENNDFYFEKYDKLIAWTYQRSINSGYLIGGPILYFFRNKNKISIVWETEYELEAGIQLWTAKNGCLEFEYSDFVQKVKDFGDQFFKAMDKQVDFARVKNWGNVEIDKVRLVIEHQERKADFYNSLKLLSEKPTEETNWEEIKQLYWKMKNEQ